MAKFGHTRDRIGLTGELHTQQGIVDRSAGMEYEALGEFVDNIGSVFKQMGSGGGGGGGASWGKGRGKPSKPDKEEFVEVPVFQNQEERLEYMEKNPGGAPTVTRYTTMQARTAEAVTSGTMNPTEGSVRSRVARKQALHEAPAYTYEINESYHQNNPQAAPKTMRMSKKEYDKQRAAYSKYIQNTYHFAPGWENRPEDVRKVRNLISMEDERRMDKLELEQMERDDKRLGYNKNAREERERVAGNVVGRDVIMGVHKDLAGGVELTLSDGTVYNTRDNPEILGGKKAEAETLFARAIADKKAAILEEAVMKNVKPEHPAIKAALAVVDAEEAAVKVAFAGGKRAKDHMSVTNDMILEIGKNINYQNPDLLRLAAIQASGVNLTGSRYLQNRLSKLKSNLKDSPKQQWEDLSNYARTLSEGTTFYNGLDVPKVTEAGAVTLAEDVDGITKRFRSEMEKMDLNEIKATFQILSTKGVKGLAERNPELYADNLAEMKESLPDLGLKVMDKLENDYSASFSDMGLFLQKDENGKFSYVSLGNAPSSMVKRFKKDYVDVLNSVSGGLQALGEKPEAVNRYMNNMINPNRMRGLLERELKAAQVGRDQAAAAENDPEAYGFRGDLGYDNPYTFKLTEGSASVESLMDGLYGKGFYKQRFGDSKPQEQVKMTAGGYEVYTGTDGKQYVRRRGE